jgi:steroid delta-isomerase-like uncharacterized protein
MGLIQRISNICIITAALPVALVPLAGCASKMKNLAPAERNKVIVLRAWDDVINRGDLEAAKELFAGNYVHHSAGSEDLQGLEAGVSTRVTMMRTAFPDLHCAVEEIIAERDMVAHRWSGTGTHEGEYMGLSPSGKKIALTGIVFSRVVDGKIVEEWSNGDDLGILQQIGVLPAMERKDYAWGDPIERTGTPVSPQELRSLLDREVKDVWGRADIEVLGEIMAPGFVNHDPASPAVVDFESFKEWANEWIDRAPDMQLSIEDTVAEGDMMAIRWSLQWTDEKGLSGFLPSRKVITITGMDMIRGSDGKIVERWSVKDLVRALKLVGIIPEQWNMEEKNPLEEMKKFFPVDE